MSSLLLLLAITPVVLICTYIYLKDKNKEPWLLLLKLFFFGALSCFLVLLVSQPVFLIFPFMKQDTAKMTFFQVMTYSFIGVALIEESCKWLMTWLGIHKSKFFDEVYDGIVYAVYVSLGFAFVENILYVLGNQSISLGITRGILAVPGHACDAVFMGYYLSLAKAYSKNKDKKKTTRNLILSVLAPTILHGYYDFCLFSGNIFLLVTFVIFVVLLWVFSIKKIKKLSSMSISLNNKEIKENNDKTPSNKQAEENSSSTQKELSTSTVTKPESSNSNPIPPIVQFNQNSNQETSTSASAPKQLVQLNQTESPKTTFLESSNINIPPLSQETNRQTAQPSTPPIVQFNQPSSTPPIVGEPTAKSETTKENQPTPPLVQFTTTSSTSPNQQ